MSIPRAPRGLPRGAEPGRGWGRAVLCEGRAGPTGLQSAAVVGVPSPRLPVGGVLSPPPFSQTAGALGTGRGERRLARGRRGPRGGPSIPADAGGHLGAPRPAPRSLCEAQPHRPASSPGAVLGRHGPPDGWKNRAPRMRGAPGRRGGQPSTERVCLHHGSVLRDHRRCLLSNVLSVSKATVRSRGGAWGSLRVATTHPQDLDLGWACGRGN